MLRRKATISVAMFPILKKKPNMSCLWHPDWVRTESFFPFSRHLSLASRVPGQTTSVPPGPSAFLHNHLLCFVEWGGCAHTGRHSTPAASGSACWQEVLNWKDLKSLWPSGKLVDVITGRSHHSAHAALGLFCNAFVPQLKCNNALQVGVATGGSALASPWFYP